MTKFSLFAVAIALISFTLFSTRYAAATGGDKCGATAQAKLPQIDAAADWVSSFFEHSGSISQADRENGRTHVKAMREAAATIRGACQG